MNGKRVLAVITSFVLFFSLTACKGEQDTSATQESTTILNDVINETVSVNVVNTEATVSDIVTYNDTTATEYYVQETVQTSSSETVIAPTQTEPATTVAYDDPCDWTKERIVEEYKNAAKKSDSTAKSTRNITLKEIKLNNGEYDDAISFVKPVIAKFIESNSTEVDGITGGFENLTSQDVNSAKAYKSGSDTVIEMLMIEQTSGAKEDPLSGSVGHAITTVGDISEVVNNLAEMGLPLEISEEETKIYYTNPTVKIVVNDDGEIVSGTWSYTVEISMNNFKAFGKNVDRASIVMENVISV